LSVLTEKLGSYWLLSVSLHSEWHSGWTTFVWTN